MAFLGLCLIGIASGARADEKKGSLVIIGGALRSTDSQVWERDIWETNRRASWRRRREDRRFSHRQRHTHR